MKLLIPSFLLFTLLWSSYPVTSIQEEYDRSSFVGLVKVKELDGEFVSVKPVQVWKNSFGDSFFFRVDETYLFREGEDYLLFAYMCDKSSILCLRKGSPPIRKEDMSLDTFRFLDAQPCINIKETLEEMKKRNPNVTGACLRNIGIPFCGCNGKRYNSECEAHNDGVMKYHVRECE